MKRKAENGKTMNVRRTNPVVEQLVAFANTPEKPDDFTNALKNELVLCRALINGSVLPTVRDDRHSGYALVSNARTNDDSLRESLESHLREAQELIPGYLDSVSCRAKELEGQISKIEACHIEKRRNQRCALELAYQLHLADTLLKSAVMVASASGSKTVSQFVIRRVERSHEKWMSRFQVRSVSPSYEELAREAMILASSYADMLNELPDKVKRSSDGVNAKRIAAKADRKAAERILKEVHCMHNDFLKKIPLTAENANKRKPAGTIPYKQAIVIMREICRSDATSERNLRRWLKCGKAGRSGLGISVDDLKGVKTWTAWCESYMSKMTGKLHTKLFFNERQHGAVRMPQ